MRVRRHEATARLTIRAVPDSGGRPTAAVTAAVMVAAGAAVWWWRPAPEPDATRPAGVAEPRGQAVAHLLERRENAVRRGDERAFLATVDPAAPPDFRDRQRHLFRDLTDVPFAEFDYRVDSSEAGTAPDVPGAEESWVPRVALRYALTGVDIVPTLRPLGYVFARRGGAWYLAADEAPGRRTWRGPWDFDDLVVRRTAQGMVLGHPGTAALADRVARQIDGTVEQVSEVWGQGWSRRVAVVLPESRAELESLVGQEFSGDGIAAVAVADRVDTSARRVEGPRVVLNPRTAARLSDNALHVVLQHEITHIATRADTAEGAPMWMVEGFADYVGYRDSGLRPRDIAPELVRSVRAHGPPRALPADADFRATGRTLDLAYQRSWSLVRHLVQRLGEPRAALLYRRIAASPDPSAVDAALHEIAGMSTEQLVRDWAAELPRTLGSG